MKRGGMMRRTPMNRGSKPMARGSWARDKRPSARKAGSEENFEPELDEQASSAIKKIPMAQPRGVIARVDDVVRPQVKEHAIQHKAYMDLVRLMPCAHCKKAGPSQFCHADEGKGTGLKTDCRRGWPGCPECHHLLGSTGKLGRDERRRLEALHGARTRAVIEAARLWPDGLERWLPDAEAANDVQSDINAMQKHTPAA